MEFNIEEELKKLPDKPGVYIMHDKDDEIIYVGKAVVLKNRVRQYFQSDKNKTPKIRKMVSLIARFEYIVVDSELEALVLECNLIKKYRPKYNTLLKDDKHYPYIKITMTEKYPRILMVRDRKNDGGKYYGPYTSADSVKNTIALIKKNFRIRNCNKKLSGEKVVDRPCLYYFMGQCPGPCMGNVKDTEYAESVKQMINYLDGDYAILTDSLREKMLKYSEALDFENAAKTRDLINELESLSAAQKADECDNNDRDIVAAATNGKSAVVTCFFVREGKMVGREHFFMTEVSDNTLSEIINNFVKQYYSGTPHIPKEIFISVEIPEAELIERMLSDVKGRKVRIFYPKKGEKARLIEMAEKNAQMVLDNDEKKLLDEEKKTIGALNSIKNLLNLKKLYRIESYDISNTFGFENVASMVVFENGSPKKSDYRKFKTRTINGADDFGSMREVLKRRFEHGLEQQRTGSGESFVRFPDLLLIDGGKGQVSSVKEILDELKISIPVCGMVKDDSHRTRALFFEGEEIRIDTSSDEFHLVTRIQDETHRFAIEYHKALRSKAQTHSILDDIKGIGPKRRTELMKYFDSLEEMKKCSTEDFMKVPSIDKKAAEALYSFFTKEK